MAETVVRDLPDFDAALRANVRVLVFKHSPACPISAMARREYASFCAAQPDVPTLFVDVVAARAVARGIAERSGVRHESPQAILFEQGKPVWNASHDAITAAMLEAAWCGGRC